MTDKQIQEKLFTYAMTKQILCGDGTGNITSHSVNCMCNEMDRRIKELLGYSTTKNHIEITKKN